MSYVLQPLGGTGVDVETVTDRLRLGTGGYDGYSFAPGVGASNPFDRSSGGGGGHYRTPNPPPSPLHLVAQSSSTTPSASASSALYAPPPPASSWSAAAHPEEEEGGVTALGLPSELLLPLGAPAHCFIAGHAEARGSSAAPGVAVSGVAALGGAPAALPTDPSDKGGGKPHTVFLCMVVRGGGGGGGGGHVPPRALPLCGRSAPLLGDCPPVP